MFTPTRLTDRDEHQGRLHALLADAVAGRGHTVLITGAVASGKTALLSTLAAPAAETGALLLETSCPASAGQLPFGLLHRLLHGPDVLGGCHAVLARAARAQPADRP
ncbi:ATP-binding protein, partial [Actinoplanes sp. NPDC026623]|uniref:ATP-binding protein n=1 Tax=Actinoplanes sp. NPDC026623 TaxID=3155610 RepID=UPI0033EC4EFC